MASLLAMQSVSESTREFFWSLFYHLLLWNLSDPQIQSTTWVPYCYLRTSSEICTCIFPRIEACNGLPSWCSLYLGLFIPSWLLPQVSQTVDWHSRIVTYSILTLDIPLSLTVIYSPFPLSETKQANLTPRSPSRELRIERLDNPAPPQRRQARSGACAPGLPTQLWQQPYPQSDIQQQEQQQFPSDHLG